MEKWPGNALLVPGKPVPSLSGNSSSNPEDGYKIIPSMLLLFTSCAVMLDDA